MPDAAGTRRSPGRPTDGAAKAGLRVVLAADDPASIDAGWITELLTHLSERGDARTRPDAAAPSVEIEHRSMRRAFANWDERSVAVLFRSASDDRGALAAQLSHARAEGLPAVLLVDALRDAGGGAEDTPGLTPSRERRRTVPGVPVRLRDIDPRDLAIMIATLSEREPARRSVEKELRVATLGNEQLESHLAEMHAELQAASITHSALVTRPLPSVDGYTLTQVFRPAGYLSGDVITVEELDDRHVGFFLADAVGHGVPAAMLTLFVAKALPKYDGRGRRRRIVPPGEALARLNNEFVRGFDGGGRFATAFYGVLDREKNTATVAGAGHPPLFVRRQHRAKPTLGRIALPPLKAMPGLKARRAPATTDSVDSGGPLLGIFPDAEFEERTIKLGDGDAMVLYTDGLESAFPGRVGVGNTSHDYVPRLADLADACATADAETNPAGAFEALLDQQHGSLHQPDDITVLVITRRGAAEAGASEPQGQGFGNRAA